MGKYCALTFADRSGLFATVEIPKVFSKLSHKFFIHPKLWQKNVNMFKHTITGTLYLLTIATNWVRKCHETTPRKSCCSYNW